ncbi:hypothetical protein ColTof4_08428 [Colletotrichum tofieldiae]|uniref:Uncharacterized protein n=1 Tax=Colletotrichum liriopes TaxID=708192 RepID=A0AA37GG38_9PEZI|nr:hypothetical protein ColLi_03147 [Colletotrichum liriopes]GKT54711.1 hypothetical protein ColTof3_02050 [Colletotrichum tofieldiae]GKT76005.1 hypothetical protein ColTof4_08428 [Colletotrichum tofieldiae]
MFAQVAIGSGGQLVGVLAAGAADELGIAAALDDLATNAVAIGRAVNETRLVLADGAAALAALDDVEDVVAHGEGVG